MLLVLLLLAAAVAAYHIWVRPWHRSWGATQSEVSMALPGDSLVRRPDSFDTHAITIAASPAAVWPWLAQIGQGRGGFYSYTLLENLVGCRITNATRIVPALQHPRLGDKVRLGPKRYPFYTIARLSPPRAGVSPSAMVLTMRDKATGKVTGAWSFVLFRGAEGRTRLVVRSRGVAKGAMASAVAYVTEGVGFVMERKMLLTLKHLAEAR